MLILFEMRMLSNNRYYLAMTRYIHRVAGITGLANSSAVTAATRFILLYCKILYQIDHLSIDLEPRSLQ